MRRILLFRVGHLGDTLVSLPALWAVRNHFQNARITMLCEKLTRMATPIAEQILRGAGVVDDFQYFPVEHGWKGGIVKPIRMARLAWSLRRQGYDLLVYLQSSRRSQSERSKDAMFFRIAGIREMLGFQGFPELPGRGADGLLPSVEREADLLLRRLGQDGISIPGPLRGSMELGLGAAEEREVNEWCSTQHSDNGRPWIAIGAGSKMPAKMWPLQRFIEVTRELVNQKGVWPVIIGGAEERSLGSELIQQCGAGYNAAGVFSIRGSMAAIKRCRLYLGNDTGMMHMAAAVKVPCVSIFSARTWPGMWYPYGDGHTVLRSQIECEGCHLERCVLRDNECLRRIGVEEVLDACLLTLARKRPLYVSGEM